MTESPPNWTLLRDAALAMAVWLLGFVILRATGTFLPLTVGAVSLAAVFLARDPALRAALKLTPKLSGVALLLAAAMIGATYGGYWLTARGWSGLTAQTAALYGLLRPERYPAALTALLLSLTAASEEVLFRGRIPSKAGLSFKGALLSSAIYALAHCTGGSWLLIALAFACGLFWACVRILTGSLTAAIAVHVLWDLAILVVYPLTRVA